MRQWFFVLGLCVSVMWGLGAAQASGPGCVVSPASGSSDVGEDSRMEADHRLLEKFGDLSQRLLSRDPNVVQVWLSDLGAVLQNIQGIHGPRDADDFFKDMQGLEKLLEQEPALRSDVGRLLLSDEVPLIRNWRNGIPTGIEHFSNRNLVEAAKLFQCTIGTVPQAVFTAWKRIAPDYLAFTPDKPIISPNLVHDIFAAREEEVSEDMRNAINGIKFFGKLPNKNHTFLKMPVFDNTTLHFLGGKEVSGVGFLGKDDYFKSIYFQRAVCVLRRHLSSITYDHARLDPVRLLRVAGVLAMMRDELSPEKEEVLQEALLCEIPCGGVDRGRIHDAFYGRADIDVPLGAPPSECRPVADILQDILETPYTSCPVHPRPSAERLPAEGRTGSVPLEGEAGFHTPRSSGDHGDRRDPEGF